MEFLVQFEMDVPDGVAQCGRQRLGAHLSESTRNPGHHASRAPRDEEPDYSGVSRGVTRWAGAQCSADPALLVVPRGTAFHASDASRPRARFLWK